MLFCKRSSMTATSLLLLLLSLFFVSPMMMMKMTTTTTACVGDFKGDARARRCFSSKVSLSAEFDLKRASFLSKKSFCDAKN